MTKKQELIYYANSTGIYQLEPGGKLINNKRKRVKASAISSESDPLVRSTKQGVPLKKERGIISVKEVNNDV